MADYAALYYTAHIAALFGVSVLVGWVAGPIFTRILGFLAGKTRTQLDDRIISAIKTPMETFLFLAVFYTLLHEFPELEAAALWLETYTFAIIVLISTFLLSEASGATIRWYYEQNRKAGRSGTDMSLLPLVRKVTKIAIYAVGFMAALSATGFDITALIAVTSVAGLIMGLASQETLANLFAGLALQLDRPYHYGDYLRLPFPGGEVVRVRKIGIRSTKLEDMFHNTIIISNSEFAKMRVTNLTLPDDLAMVPVQAELPLGSDLESLRKNLEAALANAKPPGLVPENGYSLSIDAVRPSSVLFTFSFWAKGYPNVVAIRELVNREILLFASGAKGGAKKPRPSQARGP